MLLVFIVLICNLKTAPVLVLHTEAKVLSSKMNMIGQQPCVLITFARPSLTFLEGERWSGLID